MEKKNYYEILGLTEEDRKLQGSEFTKKLKENYRNLCKRFHPDKFANASEEERKNAEEKFKEISEAYDVLSNPEKKTKYEQTGSYDGFSFEGFGNTGMADIDEMLNRFRHGFNPFGGGFGGFGGGFQRTVQKPNPMKIKLSVTVEEAYNKSTKRVRYKRFKPCSTCEGKGYGENGKMETCPVCGGTGNEVRTSTNGWMTRQEISPCHNCHGSGQILSNPCQKCNGSGRVVDMEELTLDIPDGVNNETYMVVEGKGHCAERNPSVYGDLLVFFEINDNGKYEIVENGGMVVKTKVPILDCITGCETEVTLPNNEKIKVKISMGSQTGNFIEVKGKGMPMPKGRGTLFVVVEEQFPKTLSSSEEKTIKELKSSKNFKK